MKLIGFFRELEPRKDQFDSIFDYRNLMDPTFKEAVIDYLNNGVGIFSFMGVTQDPFNKNNILSGGPSLTSDGYWIWRDDLAYFVENYNIGLPQNFIQTVVDKLGSDPLDTKEIHSRLDEIMETYNAVLLGKSDAFEF